MPRLSVNAAFDTHKPLNKNMLQNSSPLWPSPLWIAEISSNHSKANQAGFDMGRAKACIDAAKSVKADMVKFQLFRIEQLFAPEILKTSPLHQARKNWELPPDSLETLAEYAHAQGLKFACTPFDLEAVAIMAPFIDCFKIASYELLWHDLLLACLSYNKPVILSTGMAMMDEIDSALKTAGGMKQLMGLMHCVSCYPTPVDSCNLAAMDTMKQAFDLPVGWSDHSRSPAVILCAALRYQADYIEFHLDIDKNGAEYAPGHCWLPDEIAPLIAWVKDAHHAMGDGVKHPQKVELSDCDWRADPMDGLRPLQHMRPSIRNP